MIVLDALRRRPRPRLTIEQLGEARGGGSLLLRLRIDAPADVTVREMRVRVRRTVTRFERDVLGWGPSFQRTPLGTETFTRIGRLSGGSHHEEVSRVVLDEAAPPSLLARRLLIVYRALARVRLEDGRTLRASTGLRVVSARERNSAAEGRFLVSDESATGRLRVVLDRRHARPGDRLRGRVEVAAPAEGTTPPVVVDLRRRLTSRRYYGGAPAHAGDRVAESHRLSPGVGPGSATLPFELTVPSWAPPTVELDGAALQWLVCARLDDGLGRGTAVALEVNVYNAGGRGESPGR